MNYAKLTQQIKDRTINYDQLLVACQELNNKEITDFVDCLSKEVGMMQLHAYYRHIIFSVLFNKLQERVEKQSKEERAEK